MTTRLFTAAVAFALVNGLFRFIGHCTADAEDNVIRGRLDTLFEKLDAIPLSDIVFRILDRFATRWASIFGKNVAGVWRYVLVSVVLNVVVFILLMTMGRDAGPRNARLIEVAAAYALVGLLPDLLFNYLSLLLLRRALAARKHGALLLACAFDALLLYVGLLLNLILGVVVVRWVLDGVVVTIPVLDWLFTPFSIGSESPWLFIVSLAGASLQTALYLVLGILAVAARLTPRWAQRFAARVVYSTTTSRTPVFTQLGHAIGAIAAITSYLAQAL